MEAGPRTGHGGARDRGPPDCGRKQGPKTVAHFTKTCAQRMNGSKNVPSGALSACSHS